MVTWDVGDDGDVGDCDNDDGGVDGDDVGDDVGDHWSADNLNITPGKDGTILWRVLWLKIIVLMIY